MTRLLLPLLLLLGCPSVDPLAERTETEIGPAGGMARSAMGELRMTFEPDTLSRTELISIETRRMQPFHRYAIGPSVSLAKPVRVELDVASELPLVMIVDDREVASTYDGQRLVAMIETLGVVRAGSSVAPTDGGMPDIGTPDSGTPDSGEPDTGTPDGGSGCVDMFSQRSAPKADLLMVVDNSCSMTEEHQALAADVSSVLQSYRSINADFQIGVTTTDTSATGEQGALVATSSGTSVVTPSTENPDMVLMEILDLGTNGGPLESGLEAMAMALTASGAAPPFGRTDAWLTVLMVSDEDDQSSGTVASYLAQVTDRWEAPIQVNALTGELQGCDVQGAMASPAPRYDEAVQATGGVSEPICAPPWSTALTDLGGAGFGYRLRFPLSMTPGGPLTVEVNGSEVTNWTLEVGTNVVVFDAPPPPSAEIVVSYDGC